MTLRDSELQELGLVGRWKFITSGNFVLIHLLLRVLGSLEALGGTVYQRNVVAITECRVHHLPYRKMNEIEKENPTVILDLYKLLSLLTAKRHESMVDQLGTLHSIMSSTARKKPIRRSDSANSVGHLWFSA